MKDLTVKEGEILNAIAELNRQGKTAYGASIHDQIGTMMWMNVSRGEIAVALERLLEKGYLSGDVVDGGTGEGGSWHQRFCVMVRTPAARKAAL